MNKPNMQPMRWTVWLSLALSLPALHIVTAVMTLHKYGFPQCFDFFLLRELIK